MLCSVLIRHGIQQIGVIERDLVAWMEEHEYESVEQLKGSLSQKNCAEPAAFERAQYMKTLSPLPPPLLKFSVARRRHVGAFPSFPGELQSLIIEAADCDRDCRAVFHFVCGNASPW